MDHLQLCPHGRRELIALPAGGSNRMVTGRQLHKQVSIPSSQPQLAVRFYRLLAQKVGVTTCSVVVPLEQTDPLCCREDITEIKTIAKANMGDDPIRHPAALHQGLKRSVGRLSLKHSLFETT